MKVRTKLFIGFAILVSLLWAVGFLSWSIFGNLNKQFAAVEEDIIPDTIAMTELETLSNHIYREVSEYIYHDSSEARIAALTNLNRLEEIGMDYLPTMAGIMEHGKDDALAGKIFDFYFSTIWIIDLKERGADYGKLLARDRSMALPALLAMQERAGDLKAASIASLATTKASFNNAYKGGLNAIHISAAIISLAAIAAGILVTRSIIRPLLALRKGTEAIAHGNLNYKVDTGARDEIGDLSRDFDKMTESLSKSMTSIDNLNKEIDERKRAEEALTEIQEFSSSLLENAPNAIVVINPDTSIRYVNPAWEKVNGWTSSEIVGLKVPHPWWPEEQREVYSEGFKVAMEQGSGNGEVLAQKKNGERYWIDMNWVTVTHEGKPQYMIINSVDITERKQAEEALRSNEERFRLLADNSTELVSLIQILPDIKTDYVSPSCLRITGYEQEEFYNNPSLGLDIVHPEDREIFLKHAGPDNKNRHVPITIRLIRKDGRTIWIEQTHTIIYNDLGEPSAMHIIAYDITERKHAEEALRDSEERFSRAFNASPDIMAITTMKDGKYIEINESFVRLTGFRREEIIGKTTTEVNIWINPKDRREMLRKFKQQGRVYNEEYDFRVKSGEARTMLFSAEKITIAGERCMLGVCVDISERKRAEQLQKDENRVLTLMGQGVELNELLDAIIRMGESHDPAIKGSVMLFDAAEDKLVQAACPSLPTSYNKTMKNGLPIAPNMGTCGTAAYTKERVIVPDIDNSPLFPHKDGVKKMLKSGLRACWSQPIISSGGELLGTIANYKDEVCQPTADNLNVLEWSARIAAIAIERKRDEEALANEAIWRRNLIEQSRDGIVILDADSKVYEANQRFAEMLGYTMEELRELHTWDWDTQWTREELLEMGHQVDAEGMHLETYHQRKDGTFIDVDISVNGVICGGQKFIFCACRDVTERKKAEVALRESEDKFSTAFHASPDMMVIMNLTTGNYIEVNDSFVQFSGYSREELIGHTNKDIKLWVNPEEEEKMGRLLEETGKVRHGEFLFRTKSGEIRAWLFSADIINIGGDPCMLAVATDITERKKALEALHESEERFSKAFHASPGSMSISRLRDGKFIEVNDSFLKDKGYTREEVIGHSSMELGIWKDDEHRDTVLHQLQKQGRVRNELTQFRTKSGELRTGYLSAEFITLGNEPCMIVLTTDITKLKQAEEQLRLLSSVTQQVSDSTIVIDTKYKITYMNQAAVDLFGYTLEEAQGNYLGLFDAKQMSNKEKEEIKETITSGRAYKSIAIKKRKDGTTIICDCCLTPLYDENGEICSYIDVQRDITQQKEVEAKLQVHKKLIERILATMPEGMLVIGSDDKILLANEAFRKIFHTGTRTISNKPLDAIMPVEQLHNLYTAVKEGNEEKNTLEFRYQEKEIEKRIACVITKMDGERTLLTFSDVSQEREEEEKLYLTDRLASIGEMAAGLAHELNNPLTGVLALSQLLIDSGIPEEYREDLECVYNEAKRAASIVKNVLLFARNNNYENGHASVNEVVRDVLRLREYEEKVSNITAITELQNDLPDVPIDKFQLQQVFLNLILNAEAAIKENNKPGKLTVTTERSNNHINIHFNDNGCGIDKHTMPRIFDPFFTTKDIGKGTGLGLSICYGIVVKHGGKISVKTSANKGTTFTVRMPVISHN